MLPKGSKPTQKIGIMADSHGHVQSLTLALAFFRDYGCEAIYHLGDLCDSAHPESADHCVSLLRENNVFGIKGNNDHQVVVNHEGRQQTHLSSTTIKYLKDLPMIIEIEDTVMAHSLPFVNERGLSSMVGVLGHNEATLFFKSYPNKVLFRGHSHCPEILRKQKHTFVGNKISPGKTIQLAEIKSCIITCGALDEGFLMTWEPIRKTIVCHKLAYSDKP
jgi:predicted phosphodiesterase